MSLTKLGNAIFGRPPANPVYPTTRLCPATSIPPEILSEIFQLCPAQDPSDACWQEYPRPYNQVCQYWRRVIAASPLHWTNVLVHQDSRSTASEDTRTARRSLDFARVSHQLQHSQQLPMTVNVTDISGVDEDTHSAVQILCQHHSRWKKATLFFNASALLTFARQGRPWSFSELQSLDVKLTSPTHWIFQFTYRNLFLRAPKLTAVVLVMTNFRTFNLPWSQLTELSLVHVNIEPIHLQETLSQCTSLFELMLSSLKISDGTPHSTPFTIESTLRNLLLKGDKDSDDSFLLSRLRLPSLSMLFFSDDYPNSEHVKACIEASGNPEIEQLALQKVSFSHLPHTHNAITDLVALVPSVKCLDIDFREDQTDGPQILEKLLEHLDYCQDVSPSPHLTTFTLENAPFTLGGRHQELLIQMVKSRPNFGHLLHKMLDNLNDNNLDEVLHLASLKVPSAELIRVHVSLTRGAQVNEVFSAAQREELARLSSLEPSLSLRLLDGPQTTTA